jgi:hypothetical protein
MTNQLDQQSRVPAWTPILDGALADAAKRALRDIASLIGRHPERPEDLVLFWAYAHDLDDAAARCGEAVDQLLASVDERAATLHLYGGLAGIGWTLAHVGDPDDSAEFLTSLDGAIVGALKGPGWAGDYDLIRGVTGVGLYFLERLEVEPDAALAREGLDHVVQHLAARALVGDAGEVTWHTDVSLLPAWQQRLAPNGYYNCGVAHGVPGVVSMLARASAIPDPPRNARELVAAALRWLEARRVPGSGGFAAWVVPGIEVTPAGRSAWCYGDLGVATALWSAVVRTNEPVAPWRALARDCAERSPERCGVVDGSLCHGAFGLAHLLNRCFHASGDPAFRDAARAWIERGLAMRRPGEGVAGFLTHEPVDGTSGWTTTDSFLRGASGIGLVLRAALGDTEPSWDRLLACDIPVRQF